MSPAWRLRRPTALALTCLAAGLGGLAGPVVRAHADGDPASDVLVGTPVFLAPDSGADVEQQAQLLAQARAAARRGHRVRVAVIASRSDLGSVGAYWREPQAYAEFLGRELSLVFPGELLVVMPNGFGVARGGTLVPSSLARLAPRRGELVAAAEQALTRLTGTAAVASAPVTALRPRSVTSGLGWWLPTGIGVVGILALWAVSLRRAPLRLRRHGTVSSGGH